jgi:hypothetical protein
MAPAPQPEIKISETPAYWVHEVENYPSPVAQFRMAQLVDYDLRLTDPARTVYRFMIGWYMRDIGDALASVRHIVRVMRGRAPEGARHLSRSAVQRAVTLLIETGWLVRVFTGKGRAGSRYVPVVNVLELAAQGTLPMAEIDSVPPHRDTNAASVASHSTGTHVSHSTGTLSDLASRPTGTKTLLHDTGTKTRVHVVIDNNSAPVAAGLSAAAPDAGFERLVAAYDKPGDNLAKARAVFDDIDPDARELERMVRAAESWKRTATGKRMSLERWLREKRWLTGQEFVNDRRETHRWPSCVVTKIKSLGGDFDGAKIWFRDRDGTQQMQVLDYDEFCDLSEACAAHRPALLFGKLSDDLHEFVGARFQIDENSGHFAVFLNENNTEEKAA